jgi:NADH dehydrogenase [ubiquinone] 1 alpha subcomplex assembly factor 7
LRFVVSKDPTPALQSFRNYCSIWEADPDAAVETKEGLAHPGTAPGSAPGAAPDAAGGHSRVAEVEVGAVKEFCPEGAMYAQQIAQHIGCHGGAALIMDYGANNLNKDTLMGIRDHEGEHPLLNPGEADLSAWVNFSHLRNAALSRAAKPKQDPNSDSKDAGAPVQVYGPTSQGEFLHNMGIQTRLKMLIQTCSSRDAAESLVDGYQRMVDPEQMGNTYQVMAITHPKAGAPPAIA